MLTISSCCAILNPTKIVQHGEIQLEDYQKENVDNFTMLCNSEIQPKLYSMVKFSWKTTKKKTLTISPCSAILQSNKNCTAW